MDKLNSVYFDIQFFLVLIYSKYYGRRKLNGDFNQHIIKNYVFTPISVLVVQEIIQVTTANTQDVLFSVETKQVHA